MEDKFYLKIAKDVLDDFGYPDGVIKRHSAKLAEQLKDTSEQFIEELPRMESDYDEMLKDSHEQRQIDEVRG